MPDPQQVKFEAEIKVDLEVIERVVALALEDETLLLRVLTSRSEEIARALYPHLKRALSAEAED